MLIDEVLLARRRRELYHQTLSKQQLMHLDPDNLTRRASDLLPNATVFQINNVYTFLEQTIRDSPQSLPQTWPCVAPVAPVMWFEFTDTNGNETLHFAVLLIAEEMPHYFAKLREWLPPEKRAAWEARGRWVYTAYGVTPRYGKWPPGIQPHVVFMAVSPDGTVLEENMRYAPGEVANHHSSDRVNTVFTRFDIDLGVVFMALSFMHCKNVGQEIHIPDPAVQRMQVAMNKPPKVTYRTLVIDAGHAVVKREQQRVASGEITPRSLHICRGHFAEYTADKPLFGNPKNVGRFFIPMHTRGSLKAGAVVKDYEVVHA